MAVNKSSKKAGLVSLLEALDELSLGISVVLRGPFSCCQLETTAMNVPPDLYCIFDAKKLPGCLGFFAEEQGPFCIHTFR